MTSVDELMTDFRPSHSEYQIAHFIIAANGLTPYGCYQQCLREIQRRLASLFATSLRLEALLLELAVLRRRRWLWACFPIRKAKAGLRIAQVEAERVQLREKLAATNGELDHFRVEATRYKRIVGELTDQKHDELDKQRQLFRIFRHALFDLTSVGRIDPNTLGLIVSLPQEDRAKMCQALRGMDGGTTRKIAQQLVTSGEQFDMKADRMLT